MLEFREVRKHYGSIRALDDCSFSAQRGRLTGFLGPNGAGKTTAMRTAFGLVALDGGVVHWGGSPITAETRRSFGYMPEERGLYARMAVRDQLVYLGVLAGRSAESVRTSVDAWLERLGLGDRATQRLDALSHGNQQRVQLIAALVNEPELLVLDEPFSGLDPIAMSDMSDLLRELAARGTAVLFSSHQLDLVEDLCEDVVIIDLGRVVVSGELEALRAAVPHRTVHLGFSGARPDLTAVPGVTTVHEDKGMVTFNVATDLDVATLVAGLAHTSELTSFSYTPPSLSDLFRMAVTG